MNVSVGDLWYTVVTDSSLDQGDIITQCPAGYYLPEDWDPEEPPKEAPVTVDIYDLVVMTQACDLAHEKVEYVVCCPVCPHSDLDGPPRLGDAGAGRKRSFKNGIIDGRIHGYCMIAAHEVDPVRDVSVVDFHYVFSIPRNFLLKMAGQPHLRLLSPYREHVSQSFARFFMRVGLPNPVPTFS